jgi:hypothetical protein
MKWRLILPVNSRDMRLICGQSIVCLHRWFYQNESASYFNSSFDLQKQDQASLSCFHFCCSVCVFLRSTAQKDGTEKPYFRSWHVSVFLWRIDIGLVGGSKETLIFFFLLFFNQISTRKRISTINSICMRYMTCDRDVTEILKYIGSNMTHIIFEDPPKFASTPRCKQLLVPWCRNPTLICWCHKNAIILHQTVVGRIKAPRLTLH